MSTTTRLATATANLKDMINAQHWPSDDHRIAALKDLARLEKKIAAAQAAAEADHDRRKQAIAAADRVAARDNIDRATSAAYSRDGYADWADTIDALLEAGFTERETTAILLSKIPRWAIDAEGSRSKATTAALTAWLKAHPAETTPEALAALVSFAFAAEGEQA